MKHQRILLIFLFAGMFIYLLVRAIYVPLLHDEIATFFRFVHVGRFIPYYCEWSTNNHFLNSLLTFFSYKLFGYSPIAQRLPNLFFIPLFFWFIYKISLDLKSNWLRMIFIILILSFHNFMDFFSLSRGYGISLAMLLVSIWFTMKTLKDNKTRDYIYALLTMLLSVSAILIMVNSFIVIIVILLLNTLHHNRRKISLLIKHFMILLFMGLLPVIFVAVYLFDMNDVGRLDYGGMEGFWEVSVKNLTNLLVGPYSSYLNVWILVMFVLMIILFFYFLLRHPFKKLPEAILKPQWIFFYLLTGNLIGFILENKLFGILYPEERTSIQFILFFIGSLVFLLDELDVNFKKVRLIPFIPFLLLPVHFVFSMNLDFSKVDTFNFNIPDRFYEIVKSIQKPGDFPPTVQAYQLRIMRWNYHNFTKKGEQSIIHFSDYPGLDGDFQIVQPEEYPTWHTYYDIIDTEKLSGAALLKRKKMLQRYPVYTDSTFRLDKSSAEFNELAKGDIDSLAGNSVYFGFKIHLSTSAKPFHSWIVIEIRDDQNKQLRYEYIPFDWYRTEWNPEDKPFINGTIVHELPGNAKTFKAYIWNLYNKPFTVSQAEISIFRLEKDY